MTVQLSGPALLESAKQATARAAACLCFVCTLLFYWNWLTISVPVSARKSMSDLTEKMAPAISPPFSE